MKKLIILSLLASALLYAADAPSKLRDSTVAVTSKADLNSSSIRITGSEWFLSGEITLNVEIRNDAGTIIDRRGVDLTTKQVAQWYADGAKEADLQALALSGVSLTKK